MKKLIITFGIIVVAAGVFASQVDSVLKKSGFDPRNVNYDKLIKNSRRVPPQLGTIDSPDATINTKYEAALLIEFNNDNWVESILLLKEMQRVYPERADDFEKNIASIKKNKGVTDTDITEAYKKQLLEYTKGNKYFTFYVPGTTRISPEMNILLMYLTCSPSERPQAEKQLVSLYNKLFTAYKESINDSASVAYQKYRDFSRVSLKYPDIEQVISNTEHSMASNQ